MIRKHIGNGKRTFLCKTQLENNDVIFTSVFLIMTSKWIRALFAWDGSFVFVSLCEHYHLVYFVQKFCVSEVAYARYAYVHANASNLLTYDNVRLMCNVDERIRRLHSFNKTCICPAATTSQCCRTWSLSNYIALLTNRSSCAHVTAEDVTSPATVCRDEGPYE